MKTTWLGAGLLTVLSAVPAQTPTPLTTTRVAAGLSQPVLVTAPPGDPDRIFVLEQQGRIRIVKNGVLLAAPFLNIVPLVNSGGEMGLLGLAFHPRYASNGTFFVYHIVSWPPVAALARYQVSSADPDLADAASRQVLLPVTMVYGNHNAGMIAFGPDGYLYLAIGDGGSTAPTWPDDPLNHAQNLGSLLGKILRIDVDNADPYAIPPGNPFAGTSGARGEVWAYGLRNPWRFGFDRLTGDLWIADVGGQREEIDFEPAGSPGGRNYGWACMSGTYCTGRLVCACNGPALVAPIHEYTFNGIQAVIGGHVYRGCAIPDLRGTYFYADYMSSQIWSFRYSSAAGVTQFTERTAELAPGGGLSIATISSFGEDGAGELYICDRAGGEIFKIVPQTPVLVGLSAYGIGTAGCNGAHALGANCSPVVGSATFRLQCTAPPANVAGLAAIADVADFVGSDPLGIGLTLHVSLSSALFVLLDIRATASGPASLPLPLPNSIAIAGITVYAQAFWPWPAGPCTPSLLGLSSSNGLQIQIQP
jgi:glucose/arabinose dehydrogenase